MSDRTRPPDPRAQPGDFGSRQLEHFRSDKKRLPLHPLEKAVLTVVTLHLCFLPWALGTMHGWSQLISLELSVLGLGLALIPRNYSPDQIGGPAMRLTMWPRLFRFPLFWLGLVLLAYIAIQGYNPSWVWTRNANTWWLVRVNDIEWLPTSVETPFERFNLWRQFIIYASAWLTACTVWTGFVRRYSLQLLLTALVTNALVLAIVGFALRVLSPASFFGLLVWPEGASPFASFIYKNHAGAYLAIIAVAFLVLAVQCHERGQRRLARSTPAVLFLLGTIVIFFAVVFTYSRGATVILAAYLLLAGITFLLHRYFSGSQSATHPLVSVAVAGMIALVFGFGASQLDYKTVTERFELLLAKREEASVSVNQRLEAHVASTQMLADHWQRGIGAGGFRYLYPEYIKKHPGIYQGGRLFWEHAHDDWLEIPIELGAVGSLLLLLGAGYAVVTLIRYRVWRDLPVLLLCLGLIQMLLHATFDFPTQNPAVLVTWCVLLVLALRQLELEAR